MSFKELSLEETIAKITGARALIVCHRNPDADTVCSALALAELIRMTKGHARVVCADYIPARLRFMAKDYQLRLSPGEEDGKLVIAVDVASVSQLGNLSALKAKTSLIIDHHASCERFADYFADVTASSAGEIIARIYDEMKKREMISKSPRVCRYLYSAIASDTGSFKYSNTSGRTFMTAAGLVDEINQSVAPGTLALDAMDSADLSRLLFDTKTLSELAGESLASKNMIIHCDGRLALTVISRNDLADAQITQNDISTAVDVVRSVAGVLVGVSLKETNPGEYRISARSNCKFDVAAVCERFGGGGHIRAAGGRINAATPQEALETVSAAFTDALADFAL